MAARIIQNLLHRLSSGPLIALALLSASQLAQAAPIDTGRLSPCLVRLLHNIVPDLEQRNFHVNNSVRRFMESAKADHSIKAWKPPNEQIHYQKHRNEFSALKIILQSEANYDASAKEFAASTGKNRIVFSGKTSGTLYKIDLDDNRVIAMNPVTGRILTYFVANPKKYGYRSVEEYAYERCYLGLLPEP